MVGKCSTNELALGVSSLQCADGQAPLCTSDTPRISISLKSNFLDRLVNTVKQTAMETKQQRRGNNWLVWLGGSTLMMLLIDKVTDAAKSDTKKKILNCGKNLLTGYG